MEMNREFENRVALVTGAGSGIGAAIARRLAAAGAKIAVTDLNEEAAGKVAQEISATGGAAKAVQQDVSDPASVERAVAFAVQNFGALHLAVNNAGIADRDAPVADYPIAAWDKIIAINLSGVFYSLKYEVPAMLKAGGGAIVNMASILGCVGTPDHAGYVAAKHGVAGLTKTAALEYATHGIRVNAIGPGYIDTPLLSKLDETMYKGLVSLHPMGRLGRAEEVAELAAFLLSDRASFITGSFHAIDGGYTAQ